MKKYFQIISDCQSTSKIIALYYLIDLKKREKKNTEKYVCICIRIVCREEEEEEESWNRSICDY